MGDNKLSTTKVNELKAHMKNFKERQEKVNTDTEEEVTEYYAPCWGYAEEIFTRATGRRGGWE